jgi:hypothetical protein
MAIAAAIVMATLTTASTAMLMTMAAAEKENKLEMAT